MELRRAPGDRATVVLAHGFSASASHPEVAALADALHRRALTVVTYDARGHGASGGCCTLGHDERLDVAAVHALAADLGQPVVLTGISMGAIAVLRHAATPGFTARGIVVVSCPARWALPRNARGVLSAGLTQTAWGRRVAARRLGVRIAPGRARGPAPVELATRVTVPLAVVHGERDPFIPATDARALHRVAREPAGLAIVPGRWHAHGPDTARAVTDRVDALLAVPTPARDSMC